jgi:hypothetical protein
MSVHYGPIDIDCDALPYALVQACEMLGFRYPLDVRWCRMSQFLNSQARALGLFSSHPWKRLFGRQQRKEASCSCGEPLPMLEQYAFTFASGAQVEYRLAQCHRCRTMLWEPAAPGPFTL